MSVYIQEVLGLLKRNKKKLILDKQKDHFEFGKLFQNSSLNNAGTYGPRMEPFVVKWGDLVCQATEDLTRTQPGSGNLGYVPVYTDPEGTCSWDTLKDSIITQNAIGDTINIAGNTVIEGDLQVNQNANINLQLTAGSANILDLTNNRIVIVGTDGELEDDANFTMDGTTFTANVNVVHGAITTPPAVPVTTTVLNSNIVLGGPIYDSAGNIGQLSQVLVGLADGRAVWSNDDIVETLTLGSLWQGNASNLKQELAIGTVDQILISDGTTFSWEDNPAAIVGEVCTVNSIPLWTPDSNTLGCSKLFQDGNNATPATKVTSSVTFNVVNTTSSIINVGNVAFNGTNRFNFIGLNNFSSGLSSTSNGNTIVSSFYTSTAIDAYNNYIDMYYNSGTDTNKLTIGGNSSEVVHPGLVNGSVQILPDLELEKVDDDNTLDKVLVRDTTTGIIKQRDASTIFNGSGTLYRLPLWTPNGTSLGDSLLIQDGDEDTPATKVTIEGEAIVEGDLHVETNTFLEGNVEVNGTTKLDTLDQDDTLIQVLVRDTANDNLIKFRDASSIKPQVGFDTLAMTPDGWASTDGNFNAFVNLDDTTTAVKSIRDMTWLVDGDRVVVIAENIKTGSLLADNVIQFPSWSNGALTTNNFGSWNAGTNLGYPTSTLLFGEKLKFRAELYQQSSTINQLNWDACCKIYSSNICPLVNNVGFTTVEDTAFNGTLITSDDGYGGYGNTFSIITQPTNGTVTLNASTGAFVYTPNANYSGADSFTYQVNDGYCDSNIANVNMTITGIPEAPVWTSLDPTDASYGANAWTNLTGGDVLPTYNWTTNDPDDLCTNLTYSMSLVDASGNAGTWLTLTNAGNCTGTLSGTYPGIAGVWTVILTVTDPGGLVATQEFSIAGVIPDENTYFSFWVDNSGSMTTLMQTLSRQISIGQTMVYVTSVGTSPNQIVVSDTRASRPNSIFLNDIDGLVGGNTYAGDGGGNVIPATLPTGVTTSFSVQIINTTNGNLTNTNINITTKTGSTTSSTTLGCDTNATGQISAGDYLLLTISDQLASADYADANSLRSLFQDFYATGGTQASGNTDAATNGKNRYSTHVKFGLMNNNPGNGENWFYGLSNYGYQQTQGQFNATISPGGIFENASSITTLVWGDEASGSYDTGGGPYTTSISTGAAALISDVASVKNWITYGPNATLLNGTPTSVSTIGCMFAAATPTTVQVRNIGVSAGVRKGYGYGDIIDSGFAPRLFVQNNGSNNGWDNADLMIQPYGSITNPRLIEFAGWNGDLDFPNAVGVSQTNSTAGYYQNLVRSKLQDLGFQNI